MENNVPISFKAGNSANLPSAKKMGTLYFTEDKKIYFDINDTTRIMMNELSKGTDVTASKSLSFGDTFTAITDTAVDGHIITDTTTTYTMPSDRLFTTLVPTGTAIPANADLNTATYLKVGRYYCSRTVDAATLKNCPTSVAFMMEVSSPLSTTIDNENSTYVYRLRKITVHNSGIQFVQYCSTSSTAGAWNYQAWRVVPLGNFTIDSTDTNGGSALLGGPTKPVYINSDGIFTVCNNYPTYSAATTAAAGLMSAADKVKLDGIATGANNYTYTLPTASSSTLGGVKTTSTVTSTSGLTACPIIGGVPYYKDTNNTYNLSSFGITATAAELNKMDGVTATTAQINYLNGVTSSIQTQLNGKLSLSGGTMTGSIIMPDDDDIGIFPSGDNYGRIGTEDARFYEIHAETFCGDLIGTASRADKVNNSLVIKLNGGTTEGTNLFTFNGSAAKSINITPSAIGALSTVGGNVTGNIILNNSIVLQAKDSSGTARNLIYLSESNKLHIGWGFKDLPDYAVQLNGKILLTSMTYGTDFPTTGLTTGRVFFKKVSG